MHDHTFYICLGSNVADADWRLQEACRLVREGLDNSLRVSSPLRTDPVDFPNPALFTNMVAMGHTSLDAADVVALLKRVERTLGRRKCHKRQGKVMADLDLIWWDGQVLRPVDWERPYVQQAMAELSNAVPIPPSP